MASEAALALSEVDSFYGDSHVLRGVGFRLAPGRLLALLGRNGVGKTTCLSTVMGFLRPRRGQVRLLGERISGLPAEDVARRGVGLVPQGRRVFRSLTVRENLAVAARGRGGWTLERVYDLFPRLRERHAQLAGSLSGGEQQMLAIGRALMTNPRLLVLDEATEGLAPLVRAEIHARLAALKAEGLAVLLVDRHALAVPGLADRVVVVEKGRSVWEGTPASLLAAPEVRERHLGV